MKQVVVETVVESLSKVPAGASCFIEREGTRLIAKIWLRGQLKETRLLRSTGLPVGAYQFVDGTVVHRHDPETLIAELARHQCRLRMESAEFVAVAKRIAKQLGGRLSRWENEERELLGYRVTPPRSGIDDKKLERARRDFVDESVILFRTGSTEDAPIGVSIAACDLELTSQICACWDEDVGALIRKLDAECGAHLERLDRDLIALRLDRKPKQPKSYAPIFDKLSDETGLEYEGFHHVERSLADRRVFLWWD